MPDKSDIRIEIEFLAALEQGEITSQMRLSQRIAVSVGLVNALLKRAVRKGFVKAQEVPAKRYAYYLTPRGFSEKSRLVTEYLETSLDFFRLARGQYEVIFERLNQIRAVQIAFAGSGELAEIALLAAREYGIEPKAIYDSKTNVKSFHGIPIVRDISEIGGFDGIVLTESRHPQKVFDELTVKFGQISIFRPAFLRIHPGLREFNSLLKP